MPGEFDLATAVNNAVEKALSSRGRANILIAGKTGVGKSWLASALAHKACRDGFSPLYVRLPRLLGELEIARGDGRYTRVLAAYARIDLLVLDEPTSQLDPVGAQEVFAVVQELNRELEMTVLMVSHAAEQMAEYADRIALLSGGRLVTDGAPDDIYSKFDGQEKLICRSLFSWVNAGSHHAHDDVYLTPSDTMVRNYLKVFRAIFEETGHGGHYRMMMADDFVEDAEVFAGA